jgi:hypothetical protein
VAEEFTLRDAVGRAQAADNQAIATSNTLGGQAQAIGAKVTPFLTEEMLHPQGIGQAGIGAETGAALGGAGGAAAGLDGEAVQRAAASRNAGGFQAALDDSARQRMKVAGDTSEQIQAGNETAKLGQQQEGAHGLQGMYGTDTAGMLNAMGQEHQDIGAEVEANKTGWFQNAMQAWQNANKSAEIYASAHCPVKGSLYLMADGTEAKVEDLALGEHLMGIDDEPETILQIDINPGYVIELELDNGLKIKNSYCHALALPKGGFTVASKSLGKTVATRFGNGTVVSIVPAGREDVYNVITDGSHTYRADGVWAYGVGEGELTITVQQWDQIADRLIADFAVAGGK